MVCLFFSVKIIFHFSLSHDFAWLIRPRSLTRKERHVKNIFEAWRPFYARVSKLGDMKNRLKKKKRKKAADAFSDSQQVTWRMRWVHHTKNRMLRMDFLKIEKLYTFMSFVIVIAFLRFKSFIYFSIFLTSCGRLLSLIMSFFKKISYGY